MLPGQLETKMNDQPINLLLVDDDEDDYVIIRDLLSEIDWANFELHWSTKTKKRSHKIWLRLAKVKDAHVKYKRTVGAHGRTPLPR